VRRRPVDQLGARLDTRLEGGDGRVELLANSEGPLGDVAQEPLAVASG
jgi:hypothetical protein